MMLSPAAARMGCVKTTLRKIGTTGRHYSTALGRRQAVSFRSSSESFKVSATSAPYYCPLASSDVLRSWKSTMASYSDSEDEYDEEDSKRSHGHAEGAKARAGGGRMEFSHDEAWMINLGRGNNDEWLQGPRDEDEWFTGLKPSICPGADSKGIIRSLPLPNLDGVTREAAQEYFDNSWSLYETLFAGLKGEEGFYRPPPHGLRHPQIFYYGHTACLYVNKLRVSGVLDKPVNPYFESIFEVGVDEMLWDDMHKNDMLWPTVQEVHEYRKQVYEVVSDAIKNHPALDDANGPLKVNQSHPMWALFMGYEHERIHLETSSVLFRETPLHLVQSPENWPPIHPSAHKKESSPNKDPVEGVHFPSNKMIPVKTNTTVDLGKPADFPSFGWDNEYGERNMDVPSFQASEYMITNGEYYQFVQAGGYRNKEYWCEDGWAWRTHRNLKWPFFWEADGPAGSHEYKLRTIFKVINMPWEWPVDVTYYEAQAFCRWKVSPFSNSQPLLNRSAGARLNFVVILLRIDREGWVTNFEAVSHFDRS